MSSSMTASKWSPEFADALEIEFCKRTPMGVPAGMVIAGISGFRPKLDATRDENGAAASGLEVESVLAACGFGETIPHPLKNNRPESTRSMDLLGIFIVYLHPSTLE